MLAPSLLLALWTAGTQIQPVSVDSLNPYQQVNLVTQGDVLKNSDTSSVYPEIVKGKTNASGKVDSRFDTFSANGHPITRFTFLKYSGDSAYFIATVEKNQDEDDYVTVGVDKKSIVKVYGEVNVESAKKAARERKESKKSGNHRGMISLASQLLVLAAAIAAIVLIEYLNR